MILILENGDDFRRFEKNNDFGLIPDTVIMIEEDIVNVLEEDIVNVLKERNLRELCVTKTTDPIKHLTLTF